jgi:hypothetical protein
MKLLVVLRDIRVESAVSLRLHGFLGAFSMSCIEQSLSDESGSGIYGSHSYLNS